MKHNSNLIQMEDKEDDNSEDEIALIRKQHKIEKKKKSKISFPKDSPPVNLPQEIKEEDNEFVEFVLGDFSKSQSLSKFHRMTSLSLVNQNITNIEFIINSIPEKANIVFLCLNENLITSIKGIDQLANLRELYLSFNQIQQIDELLLALNSLSKLWICENKISVIENIPLLIRELWLANNSIESIPNDIGKYSNLECLNLGGNLISDFQDIYNLQTIPKITKLYLADVNFGDNPICQYTQYRILAIHFLPSLSNLDQIDILEEEKKEVENLFIKKNLYFKTKVRNTHKTAKSIIQLLNRNKLFFNQWKMLQCSFFTQRSKMLQFAHYEKNILSSQSETSTNDIVNEINSSIEKIKLCHNAISIIEENYTMLKDYLKELNNMSIVMNSYEIESGGNFKIEPGHLNQKWTKSCLELIKSKIHPSFIEKNNIKSISFNKIFKIINKKSKIIFDSLYDNLIDTNGKFGDEKKYFDFFFLIFDRNDFHSVLSFLFEDNDNLKNSNNNTTDTSVNFYLTDSLSLIDEIQLKKDLNTHFTTIICKCTLFDSLIEKKKAFPQGAFTDFQSIISALKSDKDSAKEIIKITIGEEGFYNYSVKGLIIPEYLIEYSYITQSNPGKGFVSSFTSSLNLQEDYFNLFNQCSKDLFNEEMKYYDSAYVQKYSLLKMTEFDEFDNGIFYFAKMSIISFITKCFKYTSYVDFQNEFFKIKEKVNEISNLNFQTNLLERLTTVESCEDELLSKLTIINLFNCKLTTQSLNVLFEKFNIGNDSFSIRNNITELACPHNDIDAFDLLGLVKLFPNIEKIDYSANVIESIRISSDNNANNENIFENKIQKIDLSYNQITNLKCFIDILDQCKKLTHFTYYGNPLLKYFNHINQIKFDYDSTISVSNNKTEAMKSTYQKYEEEQNTQIKPIEASKEMFELKTGRISFEILYDSYSFNDKYRIFSSSKYFKEQMSKESNKQSLILSKRKLKYIPLIENQNKTEIFWINLNKITHITNMNHFPNLYELYIQNNKIKAIENLPSTIIKLDISNNLLENITGISQTPNLIWLNVENNMITTINDVLALDRLREFHSAQNFISNVKECYQLKQLPVLELIDISGNDVCRNVHEIRLGMIFYCAQLKNLNKINVDESERAKANLYFEGRLTDGILETKLGSNYNLKELIELDLSSLKLKDTESIFSYESYPKLVRLNLSRNLFKSFTIFGYLPTLIELNLNYNIITEIKPKTRTKAISQKGLSGLPNLESLELSGNGLYNLSGIQSLINLKSLVLRENNLNKIEAITSMKFLSFLDLSFNKLRNLDKLSLGVLPSIQIILLDNNYLKNINGFAKFESVQTLSFENNKIQDTQSINKLIELPLLRDLSLNNNSIEKISNYRTTLLKMFTNLYKLDGVEITSEERDMILIEMQMGEYMDEEYNSNYFFPQQMMMKNNSTSIGYNNYNGQKLQDKGTKVNFVNLDFFSQNRVISPKIANVLPQIKPYGFPLREKPPTSDSKRVIKQGHRYVTNQVKVNSLITHNSKRNTPKDYLQSNNFPSQLQFQNSNNEYHYAKQPNKK